MKKINITKSNVSTVAAELLQKKSPAKMTYYYNTLNNPQDIPELYKQYLDSMKMQDQNQSESNQLSLDENSQYVRSGTVKYEAKNSLSLQSAKSRQQSKIDDLSKEFSRLAKRQDEDSSSFYQNNISNEIVELLKNINKYQERVEYLYKEGVNIDSINEYCNLANNESADRARINDLLNEDTFNYTQNVYISQDLKDDARTVKSDASLNMSLLDD
jgi:hypothetical protein